MRIIGGTLRGRRLSGPGGGRRGRSGIRPTSDRAREAIFNLLVGRVPGSFVLDLFAGTGAMGLEALSRGAAKAVLVDSNPEALRLIQKNIEICSFAGQAVCKRADLSSPDCLEPLRLDRGSDLVFIDPPYGLHVVGFIIDSMGRGGILAAEAVVVTEVGKREKLPEEAGRLTLFDRRSYGKTAFWLYSAAGR